jgi:hypothetical protein
MEVWIIIDAITGEEVASFMSEMFANRRAYELLYRQLVVSK